MLAWFLNLSYLLHSNVLKAGSEIKPARDL